MVTPFEVTIRGVERLVRASDTNAIFRQPLTDALMRSQFRIVKEAKQLTPVDTGRLRASLGSPYGFRGRKGRAGGSAEEFNASELDARRIPLYVTVGTNVVYARQVHQRRPFLATGFGNSLSAIQGFFSRAAVEISQLWAQGG